VVFETAYQLEQAGGQVEHLFLIAPGSPNLNAESPYGNAVALFIGTIELLSIVADQFHLVGGLWDWISGSGPESNRIRRGRVVRADLAGRAGDLAVRPGRAVVGGRGPTPAGIDGRRVPPGARRVFRRGGWRWILWRSASSTLITPIG
jgi:hypothetical protein